MADQRFDRAQLRRLRLVSLAEGATLVGLVFIAVPLKHLAGYPAATSIMGPIHGVAFLVYIWMVIQTVSGGAWSGAEITRLLAASVVPFGAFANAHLLARKEAALASSNRSTEVRSS